MQLILAVSEASSLTIALTIIVMVGVLMMTAMLKYNIDGALKIWGALGTLTGLVAGSMGTYFFATEANKQNLGKKEAEKAAVTAEVGALKAQLSAADSEKAKLRGDIASLSTKATNKPFTPVILTTKDWTKFEDAKVSETWANALKSKDGVWTLDHSGNGIHPLTPLTPAEPKK